MSVIVKQPEIKERVCDRCGQAHRGSGNYQAAEVKAFLVAAFLGGDGPAWQFNDKPADLCGACVGSFLEWFDRGGP